ncbi:hypothetical protein GCM10009560_16990 [Nonomuraea longicatena]|uniref:Uncharacterized protein n=1 Tax=Nonomuraea longicatena TaxID=83682 RepID=A0ABP3ZCF6_9ACTN
MTLMFAGGAAAAVLLSTAVAASATPAPDPKAPKIFGTAFQTDPGHDFTKGLTPRRDGILRGWITAVRGNVAEYEPIRWRKGTVTEGRFEGPPEGDVTAFASPIAKNVVFLSALGCGSRMAARTVDDKTGLGAKRCTRADLVKRVKKHHRPALITVKQGEIVRVQEIYTP